MRPRLVLGFLVLGMFLSLGCANKMFGMSRDRWLSMTPGEQSAAIDSYNTRQREQAAAEAADTQLPVISLDDSRETKRRSENVRVSRDEPSGKTETARATQTIIWGGTIDPGDMLASIASRRPSQ